MVVSASALVDTVGVVGTKKNSGMDESAFRARIERMQRDLAVIECCQALARDDGGNVAYVDGDRYTRVVPYGRDSLDAVWVNQDLSKYVDDNTQGFASHLHSLATHWFDFDVQRLRQQIKEELREQQRGIKRKVRDDDHIFLQ